MPLEATNSGPAQPGGSYLVSQFWALYAELMSVKMRVAGPRAIAARQESESPGPPALAAAQSVSRQLLSVLELQAIEAQRAGGRYASDINQEAQYVMAALADESLLRFDWLGREAWTSCLIEEALFGSRVAGDRFFERLDELLRVRDPARRDLALIYLLALSLGFEGRYRGSNHAASLQAYRVALYRFRFGRDPDPADRSRQITPQSYAFTVGDAVPQQMPHIGRWVTILILVFVGMLGISQLTYRWLAGPLIEDLRQTKD